MSFLYIPFYKFTRYKFIRTSHNNHQIAWKSRKKEVPLQPLSRDDARAPRDGKFTEKIGTYNPNTNPATVDLNFDRALYWVEIGAQPTDTVRNILKGEGVYMMKHLRGGVKKGAFDEAACQQKFDAWKQTKVAATEAVEKKVSDDKKAAAARNLEAEKKVNEAIAKKVAEKKAAAAAAKAEAEAAQAAENAAPEAPAEETPAEA